jgi:hydroxymethylglutaryl-CoA reductase (NADPH)
MAAHYRRIADYVREALTDRSLEGESLRMGSRVVGDPPPHVPGGSALTDEILEQRWALPGMPAPARAELADPATLARRGTYGGAIENFIGTVKVPVGLAGPLRVNGLHARGDYYVPLATTEAALVASYSRGAQLLTAAGGCTALVVNESISRAPAFVFDSLIDAAQFSAWASGSFAAFAAAARTTTTHGELVDMRLAVEGNHVHVILEFRTGDAAGQNMATIAADAIARYIEAHTPVAWRRAYVEGNLSGDKKATVQSLGGVRGKKVSAEVLLPAGLLRERLHTTAEAMLEYWRVSALGGVMSGSIGVQGHYANGLAGMFIACGQDAACVAEAAVGITRFEPRGDGDLYAAVTLPNLVVGTVGGGTRLPSQQACLEIMGLAGSGRARAFAEIAAGVALAGELSITGALAAGDFTRAHLQLARGNAPAGRQPRNQPRGQPRSQPRSQQ